MPREKNREKLVTRRAALLAGGQALLGVTLAGRMYQLQILDKDRYTVMADENRINLRLLTPPRGRIFDRFGVALADNRPNYRVVVVPEQAGNLEATLAALGGLIEITEADQRRVMRDAKRKHAFVPLVVRANLSWEEMARIEVAIPELAGVSVEQGLIRSYPYGTTASHVLGYVAAVSEKELTGDPLLELPDFRIGKSGIEKARDLRLRGIAGTSQIEVNAYGRVVREIDNRPGQPGQDAVLGLDMAMQDFVTRRCASEPSISCVLLDAVTGDVLALVSSPSFDPTLFSTGLTPALWQELLTDPRNPLTDKAIVPRLLREERMPAGGDQRPPGFATLGIAPRHLALVLDGMGAVVNEQGGTAYAARITDPALPMGGKSGTSQVRRISQSERDHGVRKSTEIPWKERDHALFTAFAPVGAPRYVCAVVIEHGGETGGGGSAAAAPICRDVLIEAQRRDPARRVPEPATVSEAPVPAPVPSLAAAIAPRPL